MNGKLLKIFTINPTIEFTVLFGLNPFGFVSTSITAITNPMIVANTVGTNVMYIVSPNAPRNNLLRNR